MYVLCLSHWNESGEPLGMDAVFCGSYVAPEDFDEKAIIAPEGAYQSVISLVHYLSGLTIWEAVYFLSGGFDASQN